MIHYQHCPSCGSAAIRFKFDCTDNSVSKERFPVWECDSCTLRFTQNFPEENEIGRYYNAEAYISHTDSQKGLINRVYHVVRDYTMKRKLKLVERVAPKSKGKLMDIGAGTGMFLKTMKDAGWEVKGLEPDASAREKARALHSIDLHDASELFVLREKFDVITMWHVLEHVHRLHEYLNEIKSSLHKDGRLIIAVPNYTSADASHYGQDWAAYDVPRHLYHFSPASMEKLLLKHGMKILTFKPMWFDSFYVAMLTEKYKRGPFGMLRAIWTGLGSNLRTIGDPKHCSSVIYIATLI
jgi:2-polyprenyl-3-methyl-5-hydroxy-6-metoxy-1,4-benzoquinol methylase